MTPDLATFAKAMGNGYPAAAFGGRREVMDVLRSTNRVRRTTFLVSTHDPDVESLADERISLRDGACATRRCGP